MFDEVWEDLLKLPEEEAKKKFFEFEKERRIRLNKIFSKLLTEMIFEPQANVEYIMALQEALEIFQTDILLFQEREGE